MKILEVKKADFFILDDGTSIKTLEPLVAFLHQHHRKTCVLSLREISKKMSESLKRLIDFDNVFFIGLGQGGATTLNYMIDNLDSNISSKNIRWSRQWIDYNNFYFIKEDLDKSFYCGKNVILVEDVVASGKTVQVASDDLKKAGANVIGVVSALINEKSPALDSGFIDFALYGVHTHSLLQKSNLLEAYWFPPIFSIRHLLYGQQEDPFFYQTVSEKYSLPMNQLRNVIDKVVPKF